MMEIDGPPTAWYEYADGTKVIYTSYSLKCKTAGELVSLYNQWYEAQAGKTIVWRQRPCIVEDTHPDTDEKTWKLMYRCAVVDAVPVVFSAIAPKPEGAPTPILCP